jgi:hypothetical protein
MKVRLIVQSLSLGYFLYTQRYAPCLSLVFQFEFCDEKQKEFFQRTFKTIMVEYYFYLH